MREKIFQIIEPSYKQTKLGRAYDLFMIITILISIVPLAFKENNYLFVWIDFISVQIFILDYVLRLLTADIKLKKGSYSFIVYPFTPMAVIDLLAILPSLTLLNNSFKLLRILRLIRAIKVFRLFKLFRYSRNFNMILKVFKKQKDSLAVVGTFAVGYIIASALVMYNVEPDSFPSFFDAVYWATISLTTVGYGDIYAVTPMGRLVTMISSVFGIAIIALPAGIITAGYMMELEEIKEKQSK